MRLNSIIKTVSMRIFGSFSTSKIFLPELVHALVEEFRFFEKPTTVDGITSNSGMLFKFGSFDRWVIDSMTVYNDGVFIEAKRASDDLDKALDRFVEIVNTKFGASIDETNSRTLYNSTIEVQVSSGVARSFSLLQPVVAALQQMVQGHGVAVAKYEVISFQVHSEGTGEIKPGRFLFERRIGRPYADNVFFSEAPVSTMEHLQLIDILEKLGS